MATRRDQVKAKKKARQKKTRAAARAARGAKQQSGKPTLGRAAGWPVEEAWLSEDWHLPGATIHALLTRAHGGGGGPTALVHITADLSGAGLVAVRTLVGSSPAEAQQALLDVAEDTTLVGTDPTQVARLLADAAALSRREGHALPSGLSDAQRLLADIDADEAPYDFDLPEDEGDVDTEEVPASAGGIVGAFKRLFGGA